MKAFDLCPICSGKLVTKKTEKLLKGGQDSAVVTVTAEVCLSCGEHLYGEKTVQKFEQIRSRLRRREIKGFKPIGRLYLVKALG